MPAKYDPHKHKRHSFRLKEYDYTQEGIYFVTICTFQREFLLGAVENEKMVVNYIGMIVEEEWLKTPILRSHVSLDTFVVMPNHFHGIIAIIPTGRGTTRRTPTTERFGKPVACSLPTIIRAFKSATTKRINEMRGTPGQPLWQRNYYEHIIRSEGELMNARDYIVMNPLRWCLDRENPQSQEG
jgi:REP element-mobilizing transposase RayT